MSVQRFKSLLFKATQIQREIEKEHSRRWPDWMRLLKLKKLRLLMKDKLRQFSEQNSRGSSYANMQTIPIPTSQKSKR